MRLFKKIVLISFLFACQPGSDHLNIDLSHIKVENIKIKRYEKDLFALDRNNFSTELKNLQIQYGVFLEGDIDDPMNLSRISGYINDTLIIKLYKDCEIVFPDLEELEKELTETFRYYKYYYSQRILPAVYSYISGFDYEYPVRFYENNLLIALDMYLGEDYPRYKNIGLPNYLLRKFDKNYILRDCFRAMAQNEINFKQIGGDLLDKIINEGKILWFMEAMMPELPETIAMDYTEDQIWWIKRNEGMVWAFIIENKMLYSENLEPIKKFTYEAPFTSYFGNESPPRIGCWIGWQIIRSYMNKNNYVSLDELMKEYNAQKILKLSGYKPKS